jgi:hypothetical protein
MLFPEYSDEVGDITWQCHLLPFNWDSVNQVIAKVHKDLHKDTTSKKSHSVKAVNKQFLYFLGYTLTLKTIRVIR